MDVEIANLNGFNHAGDPVMMRGSRSIATSDAAAAKSIAIPTTVSGGLACHRRWKRPLEIMIYSSFQCCQCQHRKYRYDVDDVNTAFVRSRCMTRSKRAARKPPHSYHHGHLRRALLDEALATIRTQGVSALTLREIGARLGVSRTALYRHFADKRALLMAVATEGFRMLREQTLAAWEEGGRGKAAFQSMGIAYVRFALANPAHYRVMFGGFVDPEARDSELAIE